MKLKAIVEQYKELGTVAEVTKMKEALSTLIARKKERQSVSEAVKVSEEFKCSVESAAKLINKLGKEEAIKTLKSLMV